MKRLSELRDQLRGHRALYRELLEIVEKERRALHSPEGVPGRDLLEAKKNLAPRLNESLDSLRQFRLIWHQTDSREKACFKEVPALMRENQDLIMKIIVLDRENEQALLRRGLMPPHRLPSVHRQKPHFITDLYRRHANR